MLTSIYIIFFNFSTSIFFLTVKHDGRLSLLYIYGCSYTKTYTGPIVVNPANSFDGEGSFDRNIYSSWFYVIVCHCPKNRQTFENLSPILCRFVVRIISLVSRLCLLHYACSQCMYIVSTILHIIRLVIQS